jgi:hypothetical protein
MSFCGSSQQGGSNTSNENLWQNALGPSSIGPNGRPIFTPSGAAQLGQQTLNYLGGQQPQMNQAGQAYAGALQGAAANPGFGAAQTNATNTAAGDYLAGSPALNRQLAQTQAAAGGAAADAVARQKSMFNQNGMAWGTPEAQAAQATTAQANEGAAQNNALAYLQNYQAERGAQNQAGGQLAQAYSAPLSYLGAVPGAYASGPNAAAPLISGLGSGGQVYSGGNQNYQNGTSNPSTGADIMQAASGVLSL